MVITVLEALWTESYLKKTERVCFLSSCGQPEESLVVNIPNTLIPKS